MRAVLVDAERELERRRELGLGVTFSTVEGPKLRIEWDGGPADV